MITRDLKLDIEHKGTEREIDLAELDSYGDFHVDRVNGLIIKAPVYTHGTPDSRHIRGDVVVGTDYEFVPIDVNREAVRERIERWVQVRLSDSELTRIVEEYQLAGVYEVERFDEKLDKYEILRRAEEGIISTDVEEPLIGWESIFGNSLQRALDQSDLDSRRRVLAKMFNALEESSTGSCEYSARIRLTD